MAAMIRNIAGNGANAFVLLRYTGTDTIYYVYIYILCIYNIIYEYTCIYIYTYTYVCMYSYV